MKESELILGLDIGISSVGWALLERGNDGPCGIRDAGVRIFSAGLNLSDTGKGDSRNDERRAARQRRRQLFRRGERRAAVRKVLQEYDMIPVGAPDRSQPEWREFLDPDVYALRLKALDQCITRREFGRIMYAFAHRRGFLTNRKAPPRDDEKPGELKKAADELASAITASGSRTLGEYLASLNPHEQRLRGRRTLRVMYRTEFDAIWEAQARLQGAWMTPELRDRLTRALFYQRPLRKQTHLLGFCELEPSKRRAPWALLDTQRFRLLQDANHTLIEDAASNGRELTQDERKRLIEELEKVEELTFPQARRALGLSKRTTFNLERGGRKSFIGDSTAARIRHVLGDRWDAAPRDLRERIVNDLLSLEDETRLAARAQERLGVDAATAEKFSEIVLEDGYAGLSTKAIRSILPHLESGRAYMEAVVAAYPDRGNRIAVDQLPPVPNLRNPLVQRSLSELRRVMNAIVRKHGKPAMIRIELARDLKRGAADREDAWKAARRRELERRDIAERITHEIGIPQPKSWEIERVLLAEECGWRCPYTGAAISMRDLLGDNSSFDVEHIIPFSRSLDNSFANRTLCAANYNRNTKRNRTPFEAAGETAEWPNILERVSRFHGTLAREKLRRFQLQDVQAEGEFMESFTSKDLTTTQYASRLAAEYVGRLFPPNECRSKIQVTAGRTTAFLRSAWRLNGILSRGESKTREDHRHHAVDAAVVALTTPATTQALTRAAIVGRAGAFEDLPEPWTGFRQSLSASLDKIVVSHRTDHSVSGQLHLETFYGMIRDPEDSSKIRPVLRTRLEDLTLADIEKNRIVDPAIRKLIHDKLNALGLTDPKKAFQDAANRPHLPLSSGRCVRIWRARVYQNVVPHAIGTDNTRRVKLGNNHHMEVYAIKDRRGNPSWRCDVVSLLEAMRRKRAGQPIVLPVDGDGNELVLSLAVGDLVELEWQDKKRICVVQKLSPRSYCFRDHRDARKAKDAEDNMVRITSDGTLFASGCRKLSIDPIGQYHVSRD